MDISGLQDWLLENTDQTIDDIPQKYFSCYTSCGRGRSHWRKKQRAAANHLSFMQSSLTAIQEPVMVACSSDFQVKHISAKETLI